MKNIKKAVLTAICGLLCGIARSQIPATLTDIGATAPTLGPNDISQLSVSGYEAAPDSLNYYVNNSPGCGQTFTTGASATGYVLNSLSIRTAGDGGGDITTIPQAYHLWIYSVAGEQATLVASFVSQASVVLNESDWLQWTGLSLPLLANTKYAYAIRDSVTSSWESLCNASGHPYAGGELALIPPTGGTITFGSSHDFDATFVLGLAIPATAPHAAWETLVDGSSFSGVSSFTNKWCYNYPWGTDHNGSARMDQTNVSVSAGLVTLTSVPADGDMGFSSASPHLNIRYKSGTFYLRQQVTVSQQSPKWDISGQFKAPIQKGTWPAFWLTGANSWPPESDFMEFKGSAGCNQNTYDGRWQGKITTVPGADSAWHTYRVVATLEDATYVDFVYYIDGVLKTEQKAAKFVGSPCWLIVDYQMEGSSGSPGPNYSTYCQVTNIVVKRENAFSFAGGTVANTVANH